MENKIKRLGFLLHDLSPSQISYQLIKTGNELLKTTDKIDLALFYRNFSVSVAEANFGTFTAYECFNYTGIVVATDLQGAANILKWPGPNRNKMYFYLNDLEWIRLRGQPGVDFESLAAVYLNPKLNIICRSETHKEIFESCWRKCAGVIEGGDVKQFVKLLWPESDNE